MYVEKDQLNNLKAEMHEVNDVPCKSYDFKNICSRSIRVVTCSMFRLYY